ncbi:MAG: M28 family peptidase [Opitutaceae bacterium]|nr:M28 family peptidase [Opitutaceae bacterium]
MNLNPLCVCGVLCAALANLPIVAATEFSAERIKIHTAILSSDEFEGRSPGTPGEDKTVAYLVEEFQKGGLAPGNPDGTYVQDVPLVGITSQTTVRFTSAAGPRELTPVTEVSALSRRNVPEIAVADTEVVFVGYGVVAPEYDWDDYKDVDVRGKTVLMLINDPPVTLADDPTRLDEKVFGGRAMTYYGRWTYKYEIASEKGAAACLIIHETGPAGYPFAVVGAGAGREAFDLRTPDGNAGRVPFEGWITRDVGSGLIAAGGQDFDTLKKAAARRDFRPVSLDLRADFAATNTFRDVASRNVIARLPGRDPAVAAEHIIHTAHWDHLGREERLEGDQIYNGALDNASGTAVLIELARAYATLPADARPRRSILFLAVTAEERGLLGARHYAENPLYPLTQTLANLNMDCAQVFGPSRDLEVVGYGASTIEDLARTLLERDGRVLTPDTRPEVGSYYRSDHFEFAKQGVPAFYAKRGVEIIGRPEGYGRAINDEYTSRHYHKVSDEIGDDWDFTGAALDAQLYFELGRAIADGDTWPEWKPGNEFKARRDAMLARP